MDSLANQTTQTKSKEKSSHGNGSCSAGRTCQCIIKIIIETSSSSLSSSSSREGTTEVEQTSGEDTLCSAAKHNKGTAEIEKMLPII